MNIFESGRFAEQLAIAKKFYPKLHAKIIDGIKMIITSNFSRGAKFEKLEPRWQNVFSVRVSKKDRIVFQIDGQNLLLISCLGHYGKK
jgi:Txe/YoeB family toxin of Txe-Axe toxin-antitoxin module